MTDPKGWRETNGHPEAVLLVLFLEDDLGGSQRAAMAEHVKGCWVCQAECERLNRGMCNFVEYWGSIGQRPLPQPLRRREFGRRLAEASSTEQQAGWFAACIRAVANWSTFPKVRSAAWISSAISVVLAAFVAFLLLQPSSLGATEVLNRARAFRKSVNLGKRGAIHQRVRIRQGDHVAERDLYFGIVKPKAAVLPADAPLENALAQAEIDSNDPLNPSSFAAWRDAQVKRSEVLAEGPDSYTITTQSLEEGVIESASLTVARGDWRPISQRVAFKDRAPLEITEVAYEPVIAPIAPENISAKTTLTKVEKAPPIPAFDDDLRAAPRITAAELDDAEIRLRETFHGLDVDRNEAPHIWRTADAIHYEALFQTAERKQQVEDALRGIPLVSAGVSGGGRAGAIDRTPSSAPLFTSDPPLGKALRESFGSLDLANDYVIRVRDAYLRSLPEASALQRLAERYPDQDWQNLSRRSEERLDRIAADYLARIRINSGEYLGLISPVLEDLSKPRVYANGTAAGSVSDCRSWRIAGPVIFHELRKLQESFQGLFVIEQSDKPVDLSVETLLRDAYQSRTNLQGTLSKICQP